MIVRWIDEVPMNQPADEMRTRRSAPTPAAHKAASEGANQGDPFSSLAAIEAALVWRLSPFDPSAALIAAISWTAVPRRHDVALPRAR